MSDPGTAVCYRGWLRYAHNGEEDDILAVPSARTSAADDEYGDAEEDRYLAAAVRRDMAEYGRFLSVRLWTAAVELDADRMREEFLREALGYGTAEYEMQYSEDTGYLYTTEELDFGGHNLLAYLKSQIGRFAQLEITYHREEPVR